MARVLKIYRDSKQKALRRLTVWLLVFFLLLILLLVLNSSLFQIKTITIEGNQRMTAEEIQKDFGLEKGTNLFRYFLNHVGRKFSPDPRLDSVDVYVQWPSGVRIVVQESVTIGYVYFQGTYLCLNQSGCVVDSTYYLEEELPVIRGLSIGSFALGEPLSTTDAERYQAIVYIGTILQKYDLSRIVREIDVRDMNSIVLYTDNLEIYCGSRTDMDMKIAVIHSVISKDATLSGVMHVEDLSKQIYIESKL